MRVKEFVRQWILSTPTIAQTPAGVEDLEAVQPEDENILVVTWSAPSDDGGSPVLDYSIEWLIGSTLTSMTVTAPVDSADVGCFFLYYYKRFDRRRTIPYPC